VSDGHSKLTSGYFYSVRGRRLYRPGCGAGAGLAETPITHGDVMLNEPVGWSRALAEQQAIGGAGRVSLPRRWTTRAQEIPTSSARLAGRSCRAAGAPSALYRRSSYADERRYSLYANPRIFVGPRRESGTEVAF
jgi:hypothetical protein